MKQNDKTFKTVLFILQIAKNEGIKDIDYTALVKYVYLLDYFHAQENSEHKTYTNIEWKFLNFGPFSDTFENLFDIFKNDPRLSIIQYQNYDIERNSSRIGYKGWDTQPILNDIPAYTVMKIKEAIKEFTKKTLNELLHYIYFETTPMKTTKPTQIIDFSQSIKPNYKENKSRFLPIEEKIISKNNIQKALSFLDSLDIQIEPELQDDDLIWYDDVYFKNISNVKPITDSINYDDTKLTTFSGHAIIKND